MAEHSFSFLFLQLGFFVVFVCFLQWKSKRSAACTMATVFPTWRVRFENYSFSLANVLLVECFFYVTGLKSLDLEEDLAVGR